MRKWLLAKSVISTVSIPLFFLVYFWVLHHPWYQVTTMPLTALDRWIAFRPEAAVLYASLWLYISIVPALIVDFRDFISYWIAAVILSAIGITIFVLWPTNIFWPDEYWSSHPMVSFFKSLDAPGNACPSLHVAFSIFTAIWLTRLLRQMQRGRLLHFLNWAWCVGIVYSTIAIRQHVAIDVATGALLGAAMGWAQMHLLKKAQQ